MYAWLYILAIFTVPGVVVLAGAEVSERVNLTRRGVNVLWWGVLGVLGLVGLVFVLLPAPLA